ncbi:MAG: hypothetical protein IPL59_18440 [Candidatus Competibacteraceae bacterium]|nr:hypothetical protein [Candidatus Competibacteraceae bacterium]
MNLAGVQIEITRHLRPMRGFKGDIVRKIRRSRGYASYVGQALVLILEKKARNPQKRR